MTYEELQKANASIKTTPIKDKDYAEVNQRIKAFRMLYPEGFIRTTLLSDEDGVCMFKAEVGYTAITNSDSYTDAVDVVMGTGHAYEKEGSTFINKTSYIENCETSAIGRALGMCGFGIDTAVASAEEVQTAIINQDGDTPVLVPTEQDKDSVATTAQVEQIEKMCKRDKIAAPYIASLYNKTSLDGLTRLQAYSVVNSWRKFKDKYDSEQGIPFK